MGRVDGGFGWAVGLVFFGVTPRRGGGLAFGMVNGNLGTC
jgi:hypothetical protein